MKNKKYTQQNLKYIIVILLFIFLYMRYNKKENPCESKSLETAGKILSIQKYLKNNNPWKDDGFTKLILIGNNETIESDIQCGCQGTQINNKIKRLRSTDTTDLNQISDESIRKLIIDVNTQTSQSCWFWNSKNNNNPGCNPLGNHELALANPSISDLNDCGYGEIYYPYTDVEVFKIDGLKEWTTQ